MNLLLRYIVGLARLWLCVVAVASIPGLSWAAACVAPEDGGGIAGTGAPAQTGGVGGTGAPRPLQNGGIGGTGSPQPPGHGGIGGTGQQAEGGLGGTGIVGIVTGFGSVCVNGLEVRYDEATPVDRNGLPVAPDRLALGQVVAIEADERNGALQARRIAILEALAGPANQVDAGNGLLLVMGQTVKITGETRLVGVGRLDELAPGTPLHVSGYRDAADRVIASRVEVGHGMEGTSAIGFITRNGDGPDTVGGVAVSLPSASPPAGTEVLVRGTWDGRRLHAASVLADPTLPFVGRVEKVVLEGLVVAHPGAGRLRISGFDVRYSTATGTASGEIEQSAPGQRVRVTGRLDTGRVLDAERVETMPGGMAGMVRYKMGEAKPADQAAATRARTSMDMMAPPLGLSQRMRPTNRPGQGSPMPTPGMPAPIPGTPMPGPGAPMPGSGMPR
ncbi:MAG: hypothetical protein HY777_05350 [Betaproteobacteria bacterium]|nr:hypothetical protein [Betaproteobacteria bacterium]